MTMQYNDIHALQYSKVIVIITLWLAKTDNDNDQCNTDVYWGKVFTVNCIPLLRTLVAIYTNSELPQ